jgi:hypothetical protein
LCCTGLLTDLPRKTCDGIAGAVAGTTTERLQHLLTDADWDPVALDQKRVGQMVEASPAGGMLAIDDTTFPKQGRHSVGVTHQYCGELGKRANCQAVVTAEYVAEGPTSSTPMHWPVSARLFLPDDWATDEERRRRAHVPAELQKQSKIEIALDLTRAGLSPGRSRSDSSRRMRRTATSAASLKDSKRASLYMRAPSNATSASGDRMKCRLHSKRLRRRARAFADGSPSVTRPRSAA